MSLPKSCVVRLQKEYKSLTRDPVPCVEAHPSPNNLLEWHFVLEGRDEFSGGVYHGKVTFPAAYPFKPPSIIMLTPNGRFATNTKICMSMTDFHPESWNPMWSVGTILNGLLSFMYDTANSTGVVTSTPQEKAMFAAQSLAFNVRNPMFRRLFPDWVTRHEEALRRGPEPAVLAAGNGAEMGTGPVNVGPQPGHGAHGTPTPRPGTQPAPGVSEGPAATARGPQGGTQQPVPARRPRPLAFYSAAAMVGVMGVALAYLWWQQALQQQSGKQ